MAHTTPPPPGGSSPHRPSRKNSQTFDIVVIGDGFTALNCLWNLKKKGYKNIGWSSPWPTTATTWLTPGVISSFPLDHLSRYTHRLGLRLGLEVWSTNRIGMASIGDFCLDQGLPINFGTLCSYALTEQEFKELSSCKEQLLPEAGYSNILLDSNQILGQLQTSGCLNHSFQTSAWVDTKSIGSRLIHECDHFFRLPPITQLESNAHGLVMSCADPNLKICAEIAVVACHTQTSALLPSLASALVPLVDQWDEYSIESSNHFPKLRPGDFFKLNYGQTWGIITPSLTCRIGGSRFLRNWQDDQRAPNIPNRKVSDFHTNIWHQISPSGKPLGISQVFTDILPCDELPLIGPMYNDPRILVATGFYGFGLPLAALAGQWLAQIIDEGSAPGLLRCFLPHRLRSLGDD